MGVLALARKGGRTSSNLNLPSARLPHSRPLPPQGGEEKSHCRPRNPCDSLARQRAQDQTCGSHAMKFGIFYELQLPRPWNADSEYHLLQNALDQLELADRPGYVY